MRRNVSLRASIYGSVSDSLYPEIFLPCLGRHDAYYRSRLAQTVRDPQTQVDFEFLEDELIHIEVSHKVLRIIYTMNSD